MARLIDGMRIVTRESEAAAVYDADAKELVATLCPMGPWSLAKSKGLRERGTGHKCYYIGWPEVSQ